MVDPNNDGLRFKNNVSFDHIYQLFMINQCLRGATVEALEYFESNLKYFFAYGVSKKYFFLSAGIDHKNIIMDLNLNIQWICLSN